MIQFLGPLLGGLGGLLFPAAAGAAAGGAAATGIGALLAKGALPALGAGLGTLVAGGGGKDAIRNALLMGVGVNAFPGLAGKIQGSGFGQSITGGLADIFGGGTQQAPATSPRPMSRPQGASELGRAPMSTAGAEPERTGITTAGDRQSPMSTIPTIAEINMVRPDYSTGIPAGLPSIIMPGSQGNLDERRSDVSAAFRMATDPTTSSEMFPELSPFDATNARIQRTLDLLNIRDARARPGLRGFAVGGEIEGPGTGTSDSIPAEIYQDGKPVQKAALSDGEFVMTANAVKGAGKGNRERGVSRMYELMRRFESGEMA